MTGRALDYNRADPGMSVDTGDYGGRRKVRAV